MLSLSYDETTGLVQTVASGITDREEVECYLIELEALIERSRRDWGRYWHLVDARQVEMQSEEALQCLAGASIEQLSPEDRTAVAMTSKAAVAQLNGMPSQFMTKVFRNLEDARKAILDLEWHLLLSAH